MGEKQQGPCLEGVTDSEGKVKKLLESIDEGLLAGPGLGISFSREGP